MEYEEFEDYSEGKGEEKGGSSAKEAAKGLTKENIEKARKRRGVIFGRISWGG